MKYLKRFESVIESDNEFIVTKILEQFPVEEIKSKIEDNSDETDKDTALIDMICWFEDTFNKDIENEDLIIDKLREYYGL